MVTRRKLLSLGALGTASLFMPKVTRSQMMGGGGGGMRGGGMGGGGMGGGGMMTSSPPTTPFQVPLPMPTLLKPTAMVDAEGMPYDFYEVTTKASAQEFIPGLWTPVWGYEGTFPGPTIKAKSGRPTLLRVHNALPESTVTHLHGGHVPVCMDGHAMDYIKPNYSRDYLYPNNQHAATIWYHDHTMDLTGPHVWKGLAGFYIITDELEETLPLPKGAQDVAFVIQDRLFNADGTFNYTLTNHSLMHGMQGDVILVNGAVQPYLAVSTRKYRFRILNGSNSRNYQLALSSGQAMVQIGSDGGLLPAPVTRSSILMAPGERVEVVIDFAKYRVGTQVILKNTLGSGRTADIMRFDVTKKESETASIPSVLRAIQRIPTASAIRTRTFTLGMGMGTFTINGLSYDHMRVDADPSLGTTEIWEFVNPTMMAHPMHAHDIMFQTLSRNGAAPPAWEAGWKDTWLVPAGGTVRVIGTFSHYACNPDPMAHLENYMIHCHILEHEDHGMMAQFKVIDPNWTPMPM